MRKRPFRIGDCVNGSKGYGFVDVIIDNISMIIVNFGDFSLPYDLDGSGLGFDDQLNHTFWIGSEIYYPMLGRGEITAILIKKAVIQFPIGLWAYIDYKNNIILPAKQ